MSIIYLQIYSLQLSYIDYQGDFYIHNTQLDGILVEIIDYVVQKIYL